MKIHAALLLLSAALAACENRVNIGDPPGASCQPESDSAFCARNGKQCGAFTGADNCGVERSVSTCGGCARSATCGGAGVANLCGIPGCVAESDSDFCARMGKECGSEGGTDNCGALRNVPSCGGCADGEVCGAANTCETPACVPESDSDFCGRLGKECGAWSSNDNCGTPRNVASCGGCTGGEECSSSTGACELPACVPESDSDFCGRLGEECGAWSGDDNCGQYRSVVSCGSCAWLADVVAPELGGGGTSDFVYDAYSDIHVVYVDLTDAVLRHAWRSGSQWHREVVDADVESAKVFAALGPGGTLHAAYTRYDASTQIRTIRHARRDPGGWSITTLPAPRSVFFFGNSDFALDGSGNAMIVFWEEGGVYPYSHTIKLARQIGASWSIADVHTWTTSSADEIQGPIALQLVDDRPFVAWAYSTVQVAEPTTTGWNVQVTPAQDFWGRGSFSVDASGTAHLIRKLGSPDVTHVFGSGLFWTTETATGVLMHPTTKLTLEPDGTPRVASYQVETSLVTNEKTFTMQIARRLSTGWTVATLPYQSSPGISRFDSWEPQIAGLDLALRPVLLQATPKRIADFSGLELVEFPAGVASAHDVDVKEPVGRDFSLAVGPDGRARVGYVGGAVPKLAREDTDGWERRVVPFADVVGVDSQGREWLAGFRNAQVAVAVADGASWTITSTGAAGEAVGLAFDGSDRPHVLVQTSTELKHAAWTTSGWQVTTVTGTNPGSARGMVVDAAGNPFVAWKDPVSHDLYLARLSGSIWQAAKVAHDSNAHLFALTLDVADRPCLAHTVNGYYNQLTCLAGGQLESEVIADYDSDLFFVGAARDGSGRIHLLVRENTFGPTYPLARFVRQASGAWSREEIAGSWYLPAFAVNALGDPTMVYFDAAQERLEAARP